MTHELTQLFTFPVRFDPADNVLFSDVTIFVSDVMRFYWQINFCFFQGLGCCSLDSND